MGSVLDTTEDISPGDELLLHLGHNTAGLDTFRARVKRIDPITEGRLRVEGEAADDDRPEHSFTFRLVPLESGGWTPESQFIGSNTAFKHVHVGHYTGASEDTINKAEIEDIERAGVEA